MAISAEYTYKSSFEEIYEKLTDEDFLRQKYEGVGSRNLEIQECGQDEEVFRIEWTREVPADPPAFAKKFVGEWNSLEEIMEWIVEGDTAHADYLCKIKGLPGSLTGEFELRPKGKGCVEEITMDAAIKIPLVGGKLGQLVEEDAHKSLDREYEFTRKFFGEKK